MSLSVDPMDDVRATPSLWGSAWALLVTHFSASEHWDNEEVMQWQFECHANFANSKEWWNLEPWREADTYGEVVFAGCNP